jgi:hypothetical protein
VNKRQRKKMNRKYAGGPLPLCWINEASFVTDRMAELLAEHRRESKVAFKIYHVPPMLHAVCAFHNSLAADCIRATAIPKHIICVGPSMAMKTSLMDALLASGRMRRLEINARGVL